MKVDGIQSATILSRYRPRSLGSLAVSEAETGGNKKASNKGVGNLKKFEEEFGGLGPPPVSGTGVKPDDHYQTFAGNTDDAFRIGLTVSKKQLKLYTEFYSSDVIIASPLGLRMVIGSEGEDEKKDFDFLASIEVLVLDQVWSLTQFYSVDFAKSRTDVKKCVFNKRTIKVCVSCC